ncbi:MAG: inositol monophosphatase [Patescibacteria group bacterium]
MDANAVELKVVEEIAREAGAIALKYFGKIKEPQTSIKEDGTLLTVADMEVNEFLMRRLRETFPQFEILSEEVKGMPTSNSMWIIDPIDGTKNFAAGNSLFGISIGLLMNGVLELGIVYAPAENKLYSAKRGFGAFLNGEKISVSSCDTPHGARVLLDNGASEKTLRMHGSIREECVALDSLVESKMSASVEICQVAAGEADVMTHRGLNAWDIAGGMVVASEAGALITNFSGGEKDIFKQGIVVATPKIHDAIVAVTKKIEADELARG